MIHVMNSGIVLGNDQPALKHIHVMQPTITALSDSFSTVFRPLLLRTAVTTGVFDEPVPLWAESLVPLRVLGSE